MHGKAILEQKNFHGTANGAAILIHFEKIFEDLFSIRFGAKV